MSAGTSGSGTSSSSTGSGTTGTSGAPTSTGDGRPRTATLRPAPLAAEVSRLVQRRLVRLLAAIGALVLLLAMAVVFFTHGTDVAGARAKAQAEAQAQVAQQQLFRQQCAADPNRPQGPVDSVCGPAQVDGPPADAFYSDPRFAADQGLPAVSIGVAVAGALVAALIGATAVGADWSSRALVTLITWHPRRLRLFATRLAAVGLVAAALGLVAQLVAFGLGAVVVALRGTWTPTPPPSAEGFAAGVPGIAHAHFWRDLASLGLRGVVLAVIAALVGASITMLTRHTAVLLGVAFGWFAVVETAVQALFFDRGWTRWLLSSDIAAFLTPGGQRFSSGSIVGPQGFVAGPEVVVSNLDGLALLLGLLVVVTVGAGAVLRRRDL
jgi:ABC-2 type transport system permease protein